MHNKCKHQSRFIKIHMRKKSDHQQICIPSKQKTKHPSKYVSIWIQKQIRINFSKELTIFRSSQILDLQNERTRDSSFDTKQIF